MCNCLGDERISFFVNYTIELYLCEIYDISNNIKPMFILFDTWSRYIMHFFCLLVEVGFYSDMLLVFASKSSIPCAL